MKHYFLLLYFIACSSIGFSQNYKVVGTYKGKTAQGMAVYDDYCFLLNNGGYCRIYDLQKEEVIGEYPLRVHRIIITQIVHLLALNEWVIIRSLFYIFQNVLGQHTDVLSKT